MPDALGRQAQALMALVAGLAILVHAPTSSYVGLAIGLAYLLQVRRYGLRNVALAGLLMLLCSAPTVIGASGRSESSTGNTCVSKPGADTSTTA